MADLLQLVLDALSLGSVYALFALGVGLLFGVMSLINFAHGELVMAGGYVLVFITVPSTAIRIGAAIFIVVLLALATERVAFRRVRGAAIETLLVTSFAVSFFLQSLAVVTVGALPRSVGILEALRGRIVIGDIAVRRLDLVSIGVTAVLLLSLVLFLSRTVFGLQMRAAAEDFFVARILGINANGVIAGAFAISGVLAGVGAILFSAQTGLVHPAIGLTPVLAAFIAVIIGGLGSLPGSVLGAYLLGATSVALQAGLPLGLRSFRDALVFLVVVIILVARPDGIMGARLQNRTV